MNAKEILDKVKHIKFSMSDDNPHRKDQSQETANKLATYYLIFELADLLSEAMSEIERLEKEVNYSSNLD